MTADFPIGLILIAGGLLAPFIPKTLRGPFLLELPILVFIWLLSLSSGQGASVEAFGATLEIVRIDRLSLAFGYIFAIATFLYVIFAWHVRDGYEQTVALV